MAENIVPNINRLARAVRETGGTVFWIKTTFKDDALKNWSTYFEMVKPEQGAKRVAALTANSKGHELWATLDVHPDDVIVEKNRFSAFIQGSSNLAEVLHEHGLDTVVVTGTVTNVCCEFDGARRDDAQFQDYHGYRRQRGGDRRGPQCLALRVLSYLWGHHVDQHARDLPRAQCAPQFCSGGVRSYLGHVSGRYGHGRAQTGPIRPARAG